jgi:hypothetical protein
VTGPVRHPEELAAATRADRRAQLEDGLADLDCGHCGGVVRVKKYTAAHTSIQWTGDAVRRCPAYAARDGCPYLRRSVDAAVADGWLEVAGSSRESSDPQAPPGSPAHARLVLPGG